MIVTFYDSTKKNLHNVILFEFNKILETYFKLLKISQADNNNCRVQKLFASSNKKHRLSLGLSICKVRTGLTANVPIVFLKEFLPLKKLMFSFDIITLFI